MSTTGGHDDPDRTELMAARVPVGEALPGEALLPGARLGRYRIDALLGRGGMGEVYRAEQLEPVRRTVALKLLRTHRMDARHLAYFEVERQLLAQMRHPAIAQVFDADTTADGHPFFAMEFIAGSPLTQFCAGHALGLRARIALFIRICEGVQHAHQKGVIHRDLKPGNLLVDEVDGRALPKIIDFGIATASSLAAGQDVAGTPDYMSPEQAGSDQALVDTRSDVYSLGVVLYELIAGSRPGAMGETQTALSRTLRLPSEALATLPPGEASDIARAQGLSLPQMRRTLRHELDWVVAKAMRHDRNDRYASAAALADDLQRYLDGQPLQAVPASRRYTWGKFVARHRVGLAAASVALVALLAGLGVSLYGLQQARAQRAIAEQRSSELEKVAAFQQSMLQDVDIQAMGMGIAQGLRDQIAKQAPQDAAALEQALAHASTVDLARAMIDDEMLVGAVAAIDRDFAAQPLLAANLRESVARVRMALGYADAAAAGFAQVADARTTLLGPGAVSTLQARLAQAQALLGATAPQPDVVLALVQRSLSQATALAIDDPLRLALELQQAQATVALGDRTAARTQIEALAVRSERARGAADPGSLEIRNAQAALLARMGEAKAGRDIMEAVVAARTRALGAEHPDTLGAMHNLATMRVMSGDAAAAIALQRQLVTVQTQRLGAEHPQTLDERASLAAMLTDNGGPEEALPIALSVLEARTRILGVDNPQTLRSQLNLSTLYARLGQFEKTLPLQAAVVAARIRLLGPRHPDTVFIRVNQAMSLHQAGRDRDALAAFDQVLPLAIDVLGADHPQTQGALQAKADTAQALGDEMLLASTLRQLVASRTRNPGADQPPTINSAWQLEAALIAIGQRDEAAKLRATYVQPLLDADPSTLSPPRAELAANIRITEREEALAMALRKPPK